MFHEDDGLYFDRLENGNIKIIKRENGISDAPIIFEQEITIDSWISIIGFMTNDDNPREAFDKACGIYGHIDRG